ncbi:MAG: response regulator transcription factor [Dehalococcoidales bacterium]|nr:response regulator transcription factor [Dehalococcoidales bacterium]
MDAIKVLLVDDHLLVRAGIKNILEQASDIKVIAEASNGQEAITAVKLQQPDIVLLDIQMPIMDGIDTCKQLKMIWPGIKILMLTVYEEELYALRLMDAGALGYITKRADIDEFHKAVRFVSKGVMYLSDQCKDQIIYQLLQKKGKTDILGALSDREIQVFYLIVQGKKIKDIANDLSLSVKTVENHRYHILQKLNLERTVDLVAFAHRNDLIR